MKEISEYYKQVIKDKDGLIQSLKQELDAAQRPTVAPKQQDLIDKIECLNGYLKLYAEGKQMPNEVPQVVQECDEWLEQLTPEQATPVVEGEKLYRWVKASEQLPTHYGIIAYTGGLVITLTYLDGIYYASDGSKWCNEVTHWMKRPAPPTAEPVAAAPVAPVAEGEGFDYPAAARAIALWLKKYCNEELPYPEMIADAARKVKQDRDNWVEMWRTSCDEIKFYKQFVEKERKVTKESLQLRQQLQSLQAENHHLREQLNQTKSIQ